MIWLAQQEARAGGRKEWPGRVLEGPQLSKALISPGLGASFQQRTQRGSAAGTSFEMWIVRLEKGMVAQETCSHWS